MSTVIGRVMPLPKGEYDPSETYNILDIVSDAMGSWIGTKNNIVVAPGTDDSWMLIANHGSSVKTGTAISGTGMGLTGAQGILGDKYINTDNNRMYTCVQSGTASTALWNYVTTLGGISYWSDLEGKPFATLDEYDIDDNPAGSFTITNEELKLSTYAKDRLAKVDINENISSALQDKISEPISEGTEGQALITDGNGGRSWGDVDSLVKSVESTEFAVSGAGKLALASGITDKLAHIDESDAWNPLKADYTSGDVVIYQNAMYAVKNNIVAVPAGTLPTNTTYYEPYSISALKSSLANKLIVENVELPNQVIEYTSNQFDITKSGYTPIAISYCMTNNNSISIIGTRIFSSGNGYTLDIRCPNNGTVTLRYGILYLKN